MSASMHHQSGPVMDTSSPYTSKAQHIKALMEHKRNSSKLGSTCAAPPEKWVDIAFRAQAPIRYAGPETFHQFEQLPDELKVHILGFVLIINWFITLVDRASETTESRYERRAREAKEIMRSLRCVSTKMRRLACKVYYGENWMLIQPSYKDGKVYDHKGSCFRFPSPSLAGFVERLEIHVHLRLDGLLMFPPGQERPTFDVSQFKAWQRQLTSLKDLRIVVTDLDLSVEVPWTRILPRQIQDLNTIDLLPERIQIEIIRYRTQMPHYGDMRGCTQVPKGTAVPGLIKKMMQDRTGYKCEGMEISFS